MKIEEAVKHPWIKLYGKRKNIDMNRTSEKLQTANKMSPFYRLILKIISKFIPRNDLKYFRACFHELDLEHKGSISKHNLQSFFEKIGSFLSHDEVNEIHEALDFNDKG